MILNDRMSFTEQSLLCQICIDPFDDGPRLIYCDWLRDNDQWERADWITASIELYNDPTGLPDYREIENENFKLEMKHLRNDQQRIYDLLGEAKQTATVYMNKWTWQRGFLHSITIDLRSFLIEAPRLFAVEPITHVTLVMDDPSMEKLRELAFDIERKMMECEKGKP